MMLWEPRLETRFLGHFQTLRTVQAELERARAGPARPRSGLPPLALYSKDDGLLLRAALPGLAAEDLTIEVDGDRLTMSGEWPAEPESDRAEAEHGERPRGRFSRTLQLSFEVDPGKVQAKLERGVLEIELTPARASSPVKIPVHSQEAKGNCP